MTKIRIYPYKQGSKSAKALAEAIGGRVLRLRGSAYRRGPEDLIINWGAGDSPYNGRLVANQPAAIRLASNKLHAFQRMREHGVSIPDFYTRAQDIPADAFPIMARTVLSGHSGRGIVVCNAPRDIVPAPLYVKYIKKQDEYRIHVLRTRAGETSIISVQRKAKRNGAENANFMIRNLDNGFVFVRDGVHPPEAVLEQARMAVQALDLAFGAVDVIWNNHLRTAFVLEINTAPGLEGQTVEDYARAFRNI